MKLTAPARRLVIAPLAEFLAGRVPSREAVQRALDVLRCGPRRKIDKGPPGRSIADARAAKRLAHREETAEIRAEVLTRANGRCECCRAEFARTGGAPEMDHWRGGSGRRREEQSIETCWLLCVVCHRARSSNSPDAAFWNGRFEEHCKLYGFQFLPHVEKPPFIRREVSNG